MYQAHPASVRFVDVAREYAQGILLVVKNRVDEKEGLVDEADTLHDGFVHGVAREHTRLGPLMLSRLVPVEDPPVGIENRFITGDPGDDALPSAAEAGQVVKADGPGHDYAASASQEEGIDLHLQARRPLRRSSTGYSSSKQSWS